MTAGTERKGLVLGLVGIAVFSLTLPATRIAVTGLDPLFVGAGRCVVAALLGILYLLAVRSKWPLRSEWVPLLITAGGVVFGFPLLTSLAMRQVDASHGAIVVALLPLATAAVASLRGGERPSAGFWAMGFLGSGAVILFVLLRGAGAFSPADLLLLCAVVAAGFGYAEGGKLSRTRESLEVISWALVVSLPGIAPWAGFAYVAVFSQFLGFQAWYRGLAIGGIARVGQLQLLQVFLTLFASALLLGEKVDALEVGFAATIVLIVALGRRMPVRRA